MADHKVSIEIPKEIEVGNADLKIRVKSGGERFGTLTISKGTIDWRPRNAKRGKGSHIQLSWSEFDQTMKNR